MMSVSQKYDVLALIYDVIYKTYTRRTVSHALRVAALQGSERICDIGCGTGALEEALLLRFPQVEVVGCDISHQMIRRARQKFFDSDHVTFLEGDFAALDFSQDTFDAFFSLSNVHYFPDPSRVFARARAVARPGAQLVIVDWCCESWQSRWYQSLLKTFDVSFQKIYSQNEVTTMLAAAGWNIDDVGHFSVRGWWHMMVVRATAKVF